MADDMDDIEDMLEAPYKSASANSVTNNNSQDDAAGPTITKNGSKTAMMMTMTMSDDSHDPSSNGNDLHEENKVTNGENQSKSGDGENGSSSSPMHVDKSRSNDKDREKDKDRKDSKSSRDKDRGEKDKSSKHKDRSRSRDRKKRSRSRSRSKSKKSSKRSSRSRSRDRHSNRRRSRSRSGGRRRSRSGGRRSSRDDSRSSRHRRRSSRSRTRSPVVRREKSPELTPEERDQRTVFCMQLSARIRPRDLEEFFNAVGKIRDVRLITDPRTKRSKGIAYIEFREVEAVPMAIALTGQRLLGVPIIVKLTQAEKNRLPFTGPHIPANLPQTGPIKLYVGALHPNITEEMLQGIFDPFGPIDAIVIARDEMQRSKGFGFIQFQNAEDGRKAIEQLNNFELAGKPIKVSLFISEKAFEIVHTPSGATAVPTSFASSVVSGSNAHTNLDNDELDRTGVNLGPSGKLALMAKLAEGTGLVVPQQTLDAINLSSQPGAIANGVAPAATQCFLLSNLFDLEEEKQKPNWEDDIRDDVIQECSKYGGVVHIFIDPNAPEGHIYIKCPTIAIAMTAMQGLNGRYFAGRQIIASFIPIATYHQRFPESIHSSQLLQPTSTIVS